MAVLIADAWVRVVAGVTVVEAIDVAIRAWVADAAGGISYRGVGISRAGVFVGVDVGIGRVSAWQAAMVI